MSPSRGSELGDLGGLVERPHHGHEGRHRVDRLARDVVPGDHRLLRIGIDKEHLAPVRSQIRCTIDRQGRLLRAAF